jgi:hypothetical protein
MRQAIIVLGFSLIVLILIAGCVKNDSIYSNTVQPGTTIEKPCGGVAHTVGYWSGEGTDGKTCCGSTLYTTRPSSDGYYCCGENYVIPYTCCNGNVINITTQHCCNGKVESGGGSWYDCGDQCYDPDTQSCCIEGDHNVADPDVANVQYKVQNGKASCCTSRSWPHNYSCAPDSGWIRNQSAIEYDSGTCVGSSAPACQIMEDQRRRQAQRQIPGYGGRPYF